MAAGYVQDGVVSWSENITITVVGGETWLVDDHAAMKFVAVRINPGAILDIRDDIYALHIRNMNLPLTESPYIENGTETFIFTNTSGVEQGIPPLGEVQE